MKKQILKNIASNYLVSIFGIIIGFALVPFLIKHLGKDAYGLIALVDSTILFFEVATISLRTALARHTTYMLSQGKTQEFEEYLSTGRAVLLFVSTAVFAVSCVFSWFFPYFFKVPEELWNQSRLLFFFASMAFTISIPNIVYWSVLYSKQRYDLINFSMSFGTLTRAVALFLLFSFLPSNYATLFTYGLIYIFFTWIQNFMIFFFHKSVMPGLKINPRLMNKSKIKTILSFTAYSSVQRLSAMLVGNMTHILLNIYYGPSANAVYSVSTKIPMMLRRIFTEATWSLTPTFTDLVAKNDRQRLQKLFFMYTKFLIIFTAPLCLILLLFGRQLIVLWVGKDFLVSGDLVILYTAPLLLGIPFAVCGCINNAYGKVKIPSFVGIIYSVFNIVSGIILAQYFSMGLYGFGYSNLFCAFTYLILFQPYYACKTASISLKKYVVESLIKPFGPVLILFAMIQTYLHFSPIGLEISFIRLALMALLLAVLSYSSSFIFSLNADEKALIYNMIHKLLKKIRPETHVK